MEAFDKFGCLISENKNKQEPVVECRQVSDCSPISLIPLYKSLSSSACLSLIRSFYADMDAGKMEPTSGNSSRKVTMAVDLHDYDDDTYDLGPMAFAPLSRSVNLPTRKSASVVVDHHDLQAIAERKFSFVSPREICQATAQREVERKFSIFSGASVRAASESECESVTQVSGEKRSTWAACLAFWRVYGSKVFLRPTWLPPSARPDWQDVLLPSTFSAVCVFFTLLPLWLLQHFAIQPYNLATGSSWQLAASGFGSVSVVIFESFQGPFAQPRNAILGHLIATAVGLSVRLLLGSVPWLAGPSAASLAIIAMRLSQTTHPPAGATALMVAISPAIPSGVTAFAYLLTPVLFGSVWLVLCATLMNNLATDRQYPQYWLWGSRWKFNCIFTCRKLLPEAHRFYTILMSIDSMLIVYNFGILVETSITKQAVCQLKTRKRERENQKRHS